MKFIANIDVYHNEFNGFIADLLSIINSSDVYINQPAILVDVGANVGEITEVMLKSLVSENDKVIAIDAHPRWRNSFPFLDHKNVICYNTACYSNVAYKKFVRSEQLSGWSFIGLPVKKETKAKLLNRSGVLVDEILCNTLDNILQDVDGNISFIKIDAESADYPIIKGGINIINKHRPVIVFEFNGMIGSKAHNYSADEFFDFFKNINYRLKSVISGKDETFIKQMFNTETPELRDLIAIPAEHFHIL